MEYKINLKKQIDGGFEVAVYLFCGYTGNITIKDEDRDLYMDDKKLGTEKLSKLMRQMALPSIVAQVINILYSIIDRIYIGHIPGAGASALTGVGLTLPIITFVAAFSRIVGAGGAPLAAIALGRGDHEEAENNMGVGTFLLLMFTVGIMVVFYIFKRPLLYMFGASDATFPYADIYISIYLIGTIFVQLYMGLNPYIIAEGNSMTAMLSVGIGVVLNMILDPLLIFVFKWGVVGAAIATVISQAVSAIWVVTFLAGKKSAMRLTLKKIRYKSSLAKPMLALGVSPFVMTSTESLISIVMNHQFAVYGGDSYVGAFTILQSIMQMINVPIQGFTQGVQPIISFNYGANNYGRVRKTYRVMIGMCFLYGVIITGGSILFAGQLASMFTTDAALIALVKNSMRIFMFGMFLFGLQMGIQPTFVSLGQAKISLFIAVFRKIILLIPLALILPFFMGVNGVFFAEPISDIVSAVTASALFLTRINKILAPQTAG
ncbi:MAG: MATE family efflux transporter [Lachnospiraceae bacterium]|nr:MATE family efflux transporter [Lachnospiraceae bacterium]